MQRSIISRPEPVVVNRFPAGQPAAQPVTEAPGTPGGLARPGTAERPTPPDDLPLPPLQRPAPSSRQESRPADPTAGGPANAAAPHRPAAPVIQRAEETGPAASGANAAGPPAASATETAGDRGEGEAPDLDKLARQLLPLVKRLIAVERERRPGRSEIKF